MDPNKTYFPGKTTLWLDIKPRSYGLEQRIEAVEKASTSGRGAVMVIGRSSTDFYADPYVPPGRLKIYVQREYTGQPEYETTLRAADEEWDL